MMELLVDAGKLAIVVCGLYGLYQVLISTQMFGEPRPLPQLGDRSHRFAILICAKDEQAVIGQLIRSLRKQDYPKGAFDVFVTADNCSDETARVSREAGAIVYERTDPNRRGKGFALTWFFERFLPDHGDNYDACIVFDADNVVDRGFLAAMNRQLNAGHPIAIGYRMGKNPSSSWVAGCSTLFWLTQTRTFHRPRANLGMSGCTVGGTGFMFALDVLGDKGWNTRSVCEDIEFTLNSIADGHFVAFAPDAVFYDEQPLTMSQSIKQRYRWSLGGLQVMTISGPRLARSIRSGRLRDTDAFLYSIGVLVTGLSSIFWLITTILDTFVTHSMQLLPRIFGLSALAGYLAITALSLAVLALEKRWWKGAWKAVGMFPIFIFSWTVLNMVVLFYRNTTWYTIPHTENIDIEDLVGPDELAPPSPSMR